MRREWISKIVLSGLLLGTSSWAADADELMKCRGVVQNIDSINDADVLAGCWEFYWHEGDPEDSVHSYDRILEIGERLVVLEPEQETAYGDLAWLYWSRWKETVNQPESLPQQDHYLDRLQVLLNKGIEVRENRRNVVFLYDTAGTIWEMKKDVPTLIPTMLRLWKVLLVVADPRDPEHRRLCLVTNKMLGHHYYDEGEKQTALRYFEAALVLQPENRQTQQMIEKIKRELGMTP
jgi:tetratricopeptide (TPR) repeat protein